MDRQSALTITSYNRVAPEFARVNKRGDFWLREFRALTKILPGTKVLEIGCGAGRDAKLFLQEKFDYLGTDASSGLLKLARRNNPSGKFRSMNFYKLRFPRKTFDGFWSMATLLHVPKKRIRQVLRSISRILKAGGVGAISIKEKRELDQGMIEQDRYGGVERFFAFYRQGEFTKILHDSGFNVIKTFTKKERDNSWLSFIVKKSSLKG